MEMYQTCHCVVTCNRGLNNGLNTESSKVSIKGILTLSWMILLFCEDPVVGSLTALECALDGFHKLSHMSVMFVFLCLLFPSLHSATVIFLSQNTVLLNEQKVKLCLLLCLDFELNAHKDIKLQPTTLQLNTIRSPKHNNTKSVFAFV